MDHSIVRAFAAPIHPALAALLVGSPTGVCAHLAPCALGAGRLDTDHRPSDPFAGLQGATGSLGTLTLTG
jgi:hypothetical protein